jgi:hypothetical protein
MFVLIKFADQATPVLFAVSNTWHVDRMLTMDGVEWGQLISPNGWAIRPDGAEGSFAPLRSQRPVPCVPTARVVCANTWPPRRLPDDFEPPF